MLNNVINMKREPLALPLITFLYVWFYVRGKPVLHKSYNSLPTWHRPEVYKIHDVGRQKTQNIALCECLPHGISHKRYKKNKWTIGTCF